MARTNNQKETTTKDKPYRQSYKEVLSEAKAEKFFFEQDTCGVLGKYSSFTVKIKFDKYL